MQTKGLVSVIINCRNSEKFLNQCINSVVNQTYKNLQIIIVDNQSEDNTKEIINSYHDNRINYFNTLSNLSLGAARNFAIEKTNGEFIAFVDSDDFWEENKIENTVERFTKNIGLVYSDVKYFNQYKHFQLYSHRNVYTGKCFNDLICDYNLCMSSCIISNRIIKKYNIKFDKNLKVCEDLDFFLKIAFVSELDYVDEVHANYRIHNNNLSAQYLDLFYEEYMITINNLIDFYNLDINQFTKPLDYNYINKSKFLWKQRKTKEALLELGNVKSLVFHSLFYSLLMIIPYRVVNLFYKPFSKANINFNSTN
ncbi:glycosyltransferase [Flavobacteriaceae bacterium]|jgi:glycosyltransferase involved in cell wall biosynthesis|nr:glycosyltransferase [Flavobacteriaceae bacterium]